VQRFEPPSVGEREKSRTIPAEVRAAVLERDRHRCRKCGSGGALELNHVVEFWMGGRHTVENLHTLCSLCHGEWTWSPPPDVSYDEWLTVPPARWFARAYADAMRGTSSIGSTTVVELFAGLARVCREAIER
jgi:hypothetical protein